ncbi:unnamed protein product [Bemisia tabaci]|uniref:Uncharacterized protein n=1 Tax=Bemisia tabaci TaxID=7038 RepID=A0A9P0CD53_BEMTA|nr:unnamed protein product [Bemisia tabaci]
MSFLLHWLSMGKNLQPDAPRPNQSQPTQDGPSPTRAPGGSAVDKSDTCGGPGSSSKSKGAYSSSTSNPEYEQVKSRIKTFRTQLFKRNSHQELLAKRKDLKAQSVPQNESPDVQGTGRGVSASRRPGDRAPISEGARLRRERCDVRAAAKTLPPVVRHHTAAAAVSQFRVIDEARNNLRHKKSRLTAGHNGSTWRGHQKPSDDDRSGGSHNAVFGYMTFEEHDGSMFRDDDFAAVSPDCGSYDQLPFHTVPVPFDQSHRSTRQPPQGQVQVDAFHRSPRPPELHGSTDQLFPHIPHRSPDERGSGNRERLAGECNAGQTPGTGRVAGPSLTREGVRHDQEKAEERTADQQAASCEQGNPQSPEDNRPTIGGIKLPTVAYIKKWLREHGDEVVSSDSSSAKSWISTTTEFTSSEHDDLQKSEEGNHTWSLDSKMGELEEMIARVAADHKFFGIDTESNPKSPPGENVASDSRKSTSVPEHPGNASREKLGELRQAIEGRKSVESRLSDVRDQLQSLGSSASDEDPRLDGNQPLPNSKASQKTSESSPRSGDLRLTERKEDSQSGGRIHQVIINDRTLADGTYATDDDSAESSKQQEVLFGILEQLKETKEVLDEFEQNLKSKSERTERDFPKDVQTRQVIALIEDEGDVKGMRGQIRITSYSNPDLTEGESPEFSRQNNSLGNEYFEGNGALPAIENPTIVQLKEQLGMQCSQHNMPPSLHNFATMERAPMTSDRKDRNVRHESVPTPRAAEKTEHRRKSLPTGIMRSLAKGILQSILASQPLTRFGVQESSVDVGETLPQSQDGKRESEGNLPPDSPEIPAVDGGCIKRRMDVAETLAGINEEYQQLLNLANISPKDQDDRAPTQQKSSILDDDVFYYDSIDMIDTAKQPKENTGSSLPNNEGPKSGSLQHSHDLSSHSSTRGRRFLLQQMPFYSEEPSLNVSRVISDSNKARRSLFQPRPFYLQDSSPVNTDGNLSHEMSKSLGKSSSSKGRISGPHSRPAPFNFQDGTFIHTDVNDVVNSRANISMNGVGPIVVPQSAFQNLPSHFARESYYEPRRADHFIRLPQAGPNRVENVTFDSPQSLWQQYTSDEREAQNFRTMSESERRRMERMLAPNPTNCKDYQLTCRWERVRQPGPEPRELDIYRTPFRDPSPQSMPNRVLFPSHSGHVGGTFPQRFGIDTREIHSAYIPRVGQPVQHIPLQSRTAPPRIGMEDQMEPEFVAPQLRRWQVQPELRETLDEQAYARAREERRLARIENCKKACEDWSLGSSLTEESFSGMPSPPSGTYVVAPNETSPYSAQSGTYYEDTPSVYGFDTFIPSSHSTSLVRPRYQQYDSTTTHESTGLNNGMQDRFPPNRTIDLEPKPISSKVSSRAYLSCPHIPSIHQPIAVAHDLNAVALSKTLGIHPNVTGSEYFLLKGEA